MESIKQRLAEGLKDFDPKKIKAVAIDIDGTLINGDVKCSSRTEKTIKDLIQTGMEVYIVTGRATITAMPFAKQLQLPKYMINYNGAAVYNFQTKQKEFEKHLSKEASTIVIELLREANIMSLIYMEDGFYYEIENEYLARYFERLEDITGIKKDFLTLDLTRIKKFFIMASKEERDNLYEELKKRIGEEVSLFLTTPEMHNLTYPDHPSFSMEIMAHGVNKGDALKELLASQNISMDEVVAFGDDNNDIEMLKMVKWGVAMHNARPAVKEVARLETLSNNDDGVAYFIEEYLL